MIINHLPKLLGERKMKMSELGRMVGVHRNTIYNLYHDKNSTISFELLNKICWALNIQINEIYEYVEK